MTYFSTAFKALAADPWAEALKVNLFVRLNDGTAGAPSTLVELSAFYPIMNMGTISRKREKQWGVVQGQAVQVQLANDGLGIFTYDLQGCWACLEGEFPGASESAVLAQGKISKVTASTTNIVTLEIHDTIVDILNFKLPRDIHFRSTGWASGVATMEKANGSSDYNNDYPVTVNTPANIDDETFIIEWTSVSAFKIILEDGDDSQTGLKAFNCSFDNVDGDVDILTIPTTAWTGGTFAEGDRFIFHTARPRTTDELSVVYMIDHLITDVMGAAVYDVLNGAWYSSPLYDATSWGDLGDDNTIHIIQGYWAAGTSLATLIQDALKIVHGCIFIAPTGQVGLYVLGPAGAVQQSLNGNPAQGQVDIIKGGRTRDFSNVCTQVIFEYVSLDGNDAQLFASDDDSELHSVYSKTVSIGWRTLGVSVDASASKFINRFKLPPDEFEFDTTLAGFCLDLNETLAITENELGLDSITNAVASEIIGNPLGNSAKVKTYVDQVMLESYAVIGTSLVGGPDVVW